MTAWGDTIDLLNTLKGTVEFRQKASRLLVAVRRIDENDENTLVRVLEDYRAMRFALRSNATREEHEILDSNTDNAAAAVLSRVLARVREEPLTHAATIASNNGSPKEP